MSWEEQDWDGNIDRELQPIKGKKGQNSYWTSVFIGKIRVSFIKSVLYPDKVNFEISPLKVGIRSHCWDHAVLIFTSIGPSSAPAQQAVQNYLWCCP